VASRKAHRKLPKPRIVRRRDALGRIYYAERKSGLRTTRRRWQLDLERRIQPLPKEPKPPTPPAGVPPAPPVGPFPPGVKPPGVPDVEDIDPKTIDWRKFGIKGVWETPRR
jgi:hypothetical protein